METDEMKKLVQLFFLKETQSVSLKKNLSKAVKTTKGTRAEKVLIL